MALTAGRDRVAQYVAHRDLLVDLPKSETTELQGLLEADARTRTGDPFITSEVLYQLSYVGEADGV